MNPGLFFSSTGGLPSNAEIYIQAVLDEGGTLSEPNKQKIRTLFADLEVANVYNKIKILYLYHGNTASSAGLNAVNPTNLLGAYKITWTGSPLLDINGGLLHNAGVRGNTGFHPDGGGLDFLTGAGMGFWATSTVNRAEYTMGTYSTFFNSVGVGVALSNGEAAIPLNDDIGLHFVTRESESNSVKAYAGSSLIATVGPAFNIVFNANSLHAYVAGMIEFPNNFYESVTPIKLSVFTIGLTATEVANLNTCFQTYTS